MQQQKFAFLKCGHFWQLAGNWCIWPWLMFYDVTKTNFFFISDRSSSLRRLHQQGSQASFTPQVCSLYVIDFRVCQSRNMRRRRIIRISACWLRATFNSILFRSYKIFSSGTLWNLWSILPKYWYHIESAMQIFEAWKCSYDSRQHFRQ